MYRNWTNNERKRIKLILVLFRPLSHTLHHFSLSYRVCVCVCVLEVAAMRWIRWGLYFISRVTEYVNVCERMCLYGMCLSVWHGRSKFLFLSHPQPPTPLLFSVFWAHLLPIFIHIIVVRNVAVIRANLYFFFINIFIYFFYLLSFLSGIFACLPTVWPINLRTHTNNRREKRGKKHYCLRVKYMCLFVRSYAHSVCHAVARFDSTYVVLDGKPNIYTLYSN